MRNETIQQKVQRELPEGYLYEDKTIEWLKGGYEVRKATRHEDFHGKVDVFLKKGDIERKGQIKKPSKDGSVFIEAVAVNGEDGWGLTCDLLFKWLSPNKLAIVNLRELRQNWGDFEDFVTCYAGQSRGRWYQRPGRGDICRKFTLNQLQRLTTVKVVTVG